MGNNMARTIVAKSDQLNADDLVGGPIVVKIEGITVTEAPQQPVTIRLSGGFRPWRPCKTECRVLVYGWGEEGDSYIGRTIELVRDDSVRWAGERVGGIRLRAMSDIETPIEVSLGTSKGKKAPRKVAVLQTGTTPSVDPFRVQIIAATRRAENPWTIEQVQKWLLDGKKASDIPSYDRASILARLALPPAPPPEEEF
jgi:hypothetical protein